MTFARAFAACLVTVALATAPRLAEGAPPAADAESANHSFTRGLSLAEAGSWSEALGELESAGAFRMTPQIRFHIARCHAGLGRMVEALGGIRLAIQQANDDALRQRLQEEERRLDARVPRLVVAIGRAATAKVTVDGFELAPGDLGRALPRDPGKHVIRATNEHGASFEARIELAEGGTRTVDVAFSEEALPRVTPPSPRSSIGPVVAGAVGIGLVGASVVFFALRQNAIDELDASCTSDRRCDRSLEPVADRGRTMSVLAGTFAGAGFAAAVTAVVLWARGRPDGGVARAAWRSIGEGGVRF